MHVRYVQGRGDNVHDQMKPDMMHVKFPAYCMCSYFILTSPWIGKSKFNKTIYLIIS